MYFFKLQYLAVPAETRETGSFRRSIDPERPRFLLADEIVDFAASVGSLDFLAETWGPVIEDLWAHNS